MQQVINKSISKEFRHYLNTTTSRKNIKFENVQNPRSMKYVLKAIKTLKEVTYN